MPLAQVLCVIANDAADGDDYRVVYTGVGLNYITRMMDAIVWAYDHPSPSRVWAFGAGTDMRHRCGPTLAHHCAAFLRVVMPDQRTLVNRHSPSYYGTLEEIAWMVDEVVLTSQPGEVEFVFFTQWRHMWRVRLIWRLFYQKRWGKAKFVVTRHNKQIPIHHEVGGLWKTWRVYKGYEKPRYITGYPNQGHGHMES
jgi:hypothetical protein